MKLAYLGLDALLSLEEGGTYLLVVENPVLLRNMIMELQGQLQGLDGNFVLSDKEKVMPLSKVLQIVFSPFELDVNDRRILGKLYAELVKLANGEKLYLATQEMKNSLLQYLLTLVCESDYSLDYGPEVDLKAMLAAADVRFVFKDETLLEKIVRYLTVMQEFAGKNIFVLVNMLAFLTAEDTEDLIREAAYRKLNLIFLEAVETDKAASAKKIVFDKDICLVRCDE